MAFKSPSEDNLIQNFENFGKNSNASRRWDGEINFRSFELLHIQNGDGFELGYGKELFLPFLVSSACKKIQNIRHSTVVYWY